MTTLDELLGQPQTQTVGLQDLFPNIDVGEQKPEGIWYLLDLVNRPARALSEGIGAAREGEDPLEAALRGLGGEYEYGTLGEQLIPSGPDDTWDEQAMKTAGQFVVDAVADPLNLLLVGPLKAIPGAGLRLADKVLEGVKMPQLFARYAMPMSHVFRAYGGKAGKATGHRLIQAYQGHKLAAGRLEQDLIETLTRLGIAHPVRGAPYRRAADDLVRGMTENLTDIHRDPRTVEFAQWMKKNFDEIGDAVLNYRDLHGREFKVINTALSQARTNVHARARKLGVLGKKHSEWREQVWNATVGRGALPTERREKAVKLMQSITKELDKAGVVPKPGGPSIFAKDFAKQKWAKLKNYAPQMINDDFALKLFGSHRGYQTAVRQFAKQAGVSEEKALDILRNMTIPRRAGNIEYARQLPFFEEIFEKDPLSYFPKYANKVSERIAYANEFGLDGQILNSLYKTMKWDPKSTLDQKWMSDARDIILGRRRTSRSIDELASKIMGVQVMTKMGFLSSLSNLSQNANTIISQGGTNFLKGVLRAMTHEGRRQGFIAYQKGIQDELMRLAGGRGRWAQRYLRYTGFSPVERLNRILGANAGILRAEQLIKKHGKLTKELAERGVTKQDILDFFANNHRLPAKAAERIGFIASDATQHATHWKDLPVGWQDPFMRIATQYKNFVYQQTRYLLREVLKPAKKYFTTNGKEGSIGPLLRAFATYGVGAEAVAQTRDEIRAWGAKLPQLWGSEPLDYERRERRDDYVIQLLEDSLNVGALGIAGDLVQRATYKDLASWALGPTASDVLGFGEAAVQAIGHVKRGEDLPYAQYLRQIARRVPFAPGVLPSGGAGERAYDWLDRLVYQPGEDRLTQLLGGLNAQGRP